MYINKSKETRQCSCCMIKYGPRGKYSTLLHLMLYLPLDPTPCAVFYCTALVTVLLVYAFT